MQIRYIYCQNCGIKYNWLASGFYDGDQSDFGTKTHCRECSNIIQHYENFKAIDLKFITLVSEIKYIPTNEVSINQLLQWENEDWELFKRENLFGMKRVYVNLARELPNGTWEQERKGEAIGKGYFNDRIYFYS